MLDGKITAQKCSVNPYSKKYGSSAIPGPPKADIVADTVCQNLADAITITKYFITGHWEHLVTERRLSSSLDLTVDNCRKADKPFNSAHDMRTPPSISFHPKQTWHGMLQV